jgi:hypothetical protein
MSHIQSIVALVTLLGACTTTNEAISTTETSAAVEETCAAKDLDADPNNCGACGNVCASGLCYAGTCADDRAGHVFAIGHSYQTANPALYRLLGNALASAANKNINVAVYVGGASRDQRSAVSNAVSHGAALVGYRAAKTIATNPVAVQGLLPTSDVLVIGPQPQATDSELDSIAAQWQFPVDDFLRRGGVVIVLDAPSAQNAGTARVLSHHLPLTRATVTPGATATVSSPASAAVGAVPMVFAIGESVGYAPSGFEDSVTSESGHTVVVHRAYY